MVPTPVLGGLQFTVAASGGQHTCGLTSGGEAWCWGLGESGQLGDGTTGVGWFRALPDSVRGGVTFDSLTAGSQHTCALTPDSRAYCWGAGSSGQLGIGETSSRDLPTPVAGNLFFFQIDGGGAHTCGLTFDGEAYCWGNGESGQLGDGSISNRDSPTLVTESLTFVSISTGASHTCGVTGNSRLYCWGANEFGQLGDGTLLLRLQPTEVSSDDIGFVRVEAGVVHTCGLGTDGIVYCWGFGGGGQIGHGEYENALTPTRVAGQLDPIGP